MPIELSIIVPSYQRRDDLQQVLISLAGQSLPAGRFEVIASLDGSDDGSLEMLENLHTPYRLRWVSGPNAGAGVARNRGAALAEAPILLFLDDDILAGADLAAEHLEDRGANPNLVRLGQVRTVSERALTAWESYLSDRYIEHYHKLAAPDYRPDFWDCLSGNFSLSRALWQASGGFDETFHISRHEDIELGYRLSLLGARFVYRPAAIGYHHFTRSTAAGLRDAYADGVSARRLANRWPELAAHLIDDHRRDHPALLRPLIALVLASPAWHSPLASLFGGLVGLATRLGIPLAAGRVIYQSAYHLRFWLGVRAEEATAQSPERKQGYAREAVG